MINKIKKACVIIPHPDDETLAVGGTLLLFKKYKIKTSCIFLSGHLPPLYSKKNYERTKKEALKALKEYSITNFKFCEFSATKLNEVPHSELNKIIYDFLQINKPELVFIPFPDRHIDHKFIFESSMVATRPNGKYFPKIVLSYETLSETHWNAPNIEPNFSPNFYFDISKTIEKKLKILSVYKSQIQNNESRSIEAIKSLAKFRGSQNGCKFAEAFQLIRFVA